MSEELPQDLKDTLDACPPVTPKMIRSLEISGSVYGLADKIVKDVLKFQETSCLIGLVDLTEETILNWINKHDRD